MSDATPVYVVEFCPECKGQILGQSQWHRAGCPNTHGTFVIQQVIAVPLDAALELLRAPERRGRSYGSYALAADLLEAEFGDRP